MTHLRMLVLIILCITLPGCAAGLSCNRDVDQVSAVYQAEDGKLLQACFDLKEQQVTLRPSNGLLHVLPIAISGSGARYSDGTFTFWEHQGTGRFFEGELLLFEGVSKHR